MTKQSDVTAAIQQYREQFAIVRASLDQIDQSLAAIGTEGQATPAVVDSLHASFQRMNEAVKLADSARGEILRVAVAEGQQKPNDRVQQAISDLEAQAKKMNNPLMPKGSV